MEEVADAGKYTMKRDARIWGLIKQIVKHKVTSTSLLFLVAIHIVVFLAPLFWGQSPEAVDPANKLAPWSLEHPLGPDDGRRDVLRRMMYGGKITFLVGFCSMLFTVFIGGLIGVMAGYFGGLIDIFLMRFTEAMLSIPNFFLALVALTVFGKSPLMVVLVIAFTTWMEIASVVYG